MRLLVLGAAALVGSIQVQAQTIVAGHTPGSFRVTESGAAEYRIPIRVPPGIAGMEPRLALVYNSQAGNGLLGVGWNLEGLSAITRCPRTMAQDGVRGGVNYDANDRFCLDGQRLMAISGAYGADGTEYRTERESFTKVISYGTAGNGPAWFKAWTKSGQIVEYGNTVDSRIEAQGKITARLWAVNRVSDTKGNYLIATYTEDGANGENRPDRIDYVAASGSANRSVRFTYTARTDAAPRYLAGSSIKDTSRLTYVRSYASESALAREYRFEYDNQATAQVSRLITVTECDATGQCMAPTQFGMGASTDNPPFTAIQNLAGGNGGYNGYKAYIGDFNGDGRADILWDYKQQWSSPPQGYQTVHSAGYRFLWLGNGDGTFSIISNVAGQDGYYIGWAPVLGDFNGDGKTDILWDSKDPYGRSSGNRNLWTSNGNGTFSITANVNGMDGAYWGYVPMVGDFNGDGRADILWDYKDSYQRSAGYRTIWMNNGSGQFAVHNNLNSTDGYYMGYAPHLADFNGDGMTDIFWDYKDGYFRSSGARALWTSNGNGSFDVNANPAGSNGAYYGYGPDFADFNGDGIADILWDYKDAYGRSAGNRILWIGKGDGNFVVHGNLMSQDGYYIAWSPVLGDFNGDGKADILWDTKDEYGRSTGYRNAWMSKGDGTFLLFGNVAGSNGYYWGYVPTVADFNGDGKGDIMWNYVWGDGRSAGYRDLWIRTADSSDLLLTVANGAGALTTVTYSALTPGSAYSKGTAATYPDQDIAPSLRVVTSTTSDSGMGATTAATWSYAGLRVNLAGRGLLGFESIQSTDQLTGIRASIQARQDWPYVGMPSVVKKTQSSGTVLGESSNTMSCIDPTTGAACTVATGNRYFPYVSQSVETASDLNGAALPTVTTTTQYDGFGNATSVVVSTGDGYSKATSNAFSNDTSNWFLGRLIRSTVQSTAP